MVAALIAFGFIAVLSFLVAIAVVHFLVRNGFVWLVVCVIIGAALYVAYFFSSKALGAPESGDYLRFILLWVLVVPVLLGVLLSGVVGAVRWVRRSR